MHGIVQQLDQTTDDIPQALEADLSYKWGNRWFPHASHSGLWGKGCPRQQSLRAALPGDPPPLSPVTFRLARAPLLPSPGGRVSGEGSRVAVLSGIPA